MGLRNTAIKTFEYAFINLYRIANKIYSENQSPVFYTHMAIWGVLMGGGLLPIFMIVDITMYDYGLNKTHWMILAIIFMIFWYFFVESRYNSKKADLLLKNYDPKNYSYCKYIIMLIFLMIAGLYIYTWALLDID